VATDAPLVVRIPRSGILVAESVHADGFSMRARVDEFHKLICVVRGRCELTRVDAPGRELSSLAIAVVPAGVRHSLMDRDPATVLLLCLSANLIEARPSRRELWKGVATAESFAPPTVRTVIHLVREMLFEQVHSQDAPDSRLAVGALADRVLVALYRGLGSDHRESAVRRVTATMRQVEAAPFSEWTPENAADRAGLSVRRFGDVHRQLAGESFARRLARLRIEYSCRLLQFHGYSIPGAAFSSGFHDITTYYRTFKRIIGAPPGRWLEDQSG
jgi:AraC family L-rhamnose operon regulatory protein RhaS